MITFAFGDAKRISKRLADLDPEREKIMELRRAESQTEMKGKLRVENAE
jgi:hypothetical protein